MAQKYLVDKLVDFLKFCIIIGLLCFFTIKAPGQIEKIITATGAFILGGSNLKTKIGL